MKGGSRAQLRARGRTVFLGRLPAVPFSLVFSAAVVFAFAAPAVPPATSEIPSAGFVSGAGRDAPVPVDARRPGMLYGGPPPGNKTRADTLYVLGGPDRLDGKFQTTAGSPDPQGWIGVDLTAPPSSFWHIDPYNAALLDPSHTPNHAFWCGECFANACGCGYGNNYNELLDWYGTVDDNSVATTVRVTARLNYDNEPGYDYLYLLVERSAGMAEVQNWNGSNETGGVFVPVDVDITTMVGTGDYTGPANDQVHLRWLAVSDGWLSDEDCVWDTEGHCQIDNIRVSFDGTSRSFDDFEPGSSSTWAPALLPGVGNFAKVWPCLGDIDVCNENQTPQFAFIDDGLVVPGTGGSPCQSWCYGPGGWIVNLNGGLAGPTCHLNNEIWSPVLEWPAGGYTDASYDYDIYAHLPLMTGLYSVWHVRSSTDGGQTWSGWEDRSFVDIYSNAARYLRRVNRVGDLMLPGRTHVQLALGLYEIGWIWGYNDNDGTPAPYYDNVAFKVWEFEGPAITAREIDIANDGFPQSGTLDYANLGNNSVRFDMARNISLSAHLRNDPGDSIIVDVVPVREGSTLQGMPVLHYKLKRNWLFNAYRNSGLPDEADVPGRLTYTGTGSLVHDRYNFDLPDTGFFYPGDVLHYYIRAEDSLGGVSHLPADRSGFGVFPGSPGYIPMLYDAHFIVRALPTMQSPTPGSQPSVLWWNDFDTRGGENEWIWALYSYLDFEGIVCDFYYTNGPSSGVGNGLGGRATAAQLAGYRTLLYTSGDLGSYTLANGDYSKDPSRDLQVLDSWLRQGGKQAFFTGDDLAFDLNRSGPLGTSFIGTWLGVTYNGNDVRPLLNNQSSPLVKVVPGNPVHPNLVTHYAYGGCPIINDFDAVTATGAASRVMRFCDPSGTPAYDYAAMVYNPVAAYTAQVVYMPYDLMSIYTPPGWSSLQPARSRLLDQVLMFFDYICCGPDLLDAPPLGEGLGVAVTAHPNPFNPATRIEYAMPQAGRLAIRIYNLRGELVRMLLDAEVEAGRGVVDWRGDDDGGRDVAAGVYFCETRAHGQTLVNKLALVK